MVTKQTERFTYDLGNYESALKTLLIHMQETGVSQRLWNGDKELWTGEDEDRWLGWLDIASVELSQLDIFQSVAKEVVDRFTFCVLLGMGGSSLCTEVLTRTFGVIERFPQLIVLDSVVPAQVDAVRMRVDLKKTLFIVSSKSGSTTEPNVLCQYFYDQVSQVLKQPGDSFIAITDPGSSMDETAVRLKFRHRYPGVPTIGGRYSALSHFGMLPAAIMGLDVAKILHNAQAMAQSCGPSAMPKENPGLVLGAIMGILAKDGRDKVTLVASDRIKSFGMWLEQLIAESTGKKGRGIVPIDGEELAEPEVYGSDRLFVYLRFKSEPDTNQDLMLANLQRAGHPLVRIEIDDLSDLGGEFFRWEFATAVAGAVIGINPFNQPNVQESKDYTKRFLKQYTEHKSLPEDVLIYEDGHIQLFADDANKEELTKATSNPSLANYLKAHLCRIERGDYFATTAYIEYEEGLREIIQSMRKHVRDRYKVATTFGYGPRFLHSTGQLHKGGPNTGVFLQITSDDRKDLPIPGEKFTFGILKQAQSLGDFLALSACNRRTLRVHIKADLKTGLKHVAQALLGL